MAAHVNGRIAARLAWPIGGLACALALASQVFRALNRGVPIPADLKGNEPVFVLAFVLASTIGALIAARRPRNRIGWILLCAGGVVDDGVGLPDPPPPAAGGAWDWPRCGRGRRNWVGRAASSGRPAAAPASWPTCPS